MAARAVRLAPRRDRGLTFDAAARDGFLPDSGIGCARVAPTGGLAIGAPTLLRNDLQSGRYRAYMGPSRSKETQMTTQTSDTDQDTLEAMLGQAKDKVREGSTGCQGDSRLARRCRPIQPEHAGVCGA